MKRRVWLLCICIMSMLLICLTSCANESNEFPLEGQLGDNVYYTYECDSGIVWIHGSGDTWSCSPSEPSPFTAAGDSLNAKTVVIENGVSSIGAYLFCGCEGIERMIVAESVERLECPSLPKNAEVCFYGDAPECPEADASRGKAAYLGCEGSNIYICGWDGWHDFAYRDSSGKLLELKLGQPGGLSDMTGSLSGNVYYIYDETLCTLFIYGSGDMYNGFVYGYFNAPVSPFDDRWLEEFPIKKVIVRDGVTSLGGGLINGCDGIEEVYLAQSVKKLATLSLPKDAEVFFYGDAPEVVPSDVVVNVEQSFLGCAESNIYRLPDSSGWDDFTYTDSNGQRLEVKVVDGN